MKRTMIWPGGLALGLALTTPAWAQLESTYEAVPQKEGGLVEGKPGIIPPSPGPNPTVVPGTTTQDLNTPAATQATTPEAIPNASQITPGLANKADLQTPAEQDQQPADEEGMEIYTRGPLHEAFATPSETVNPASPVIATQPPELINEVPPEQMPEGTNVVWIPGYWAFDQDLNDYLWISGIWRDVPDGRKWVPGYWTQVDGGSQWVPGMWMDEQVAEISYYPEPPATLERGPSSPAPGDNYFYVPGCWEYANNDYQWRAGYWDQYRDDYLWVNSSYSYTPAGYVYNTGYWDYGLANRGLVYAPVRFNRGGWNGIYRPRVVIGSWDNLMVHMFIRPGYNQYAFGNYYGQNYVNMGFRPWYNYGWGGRGGFGGYGGGRYAYNPIFSYYNWRYGNNFYGRLDRWNNYYNNNPDWRPRNTWRDQRDFVRTVGQRNDFDRSIVRNSLIGLDLNNNNRNDLRALNIDRQLPVNLRRNNNDLARNNDAWRDVVSQRRDFESRGQGGKNEIERRESLKINFPEQLDNRPDRQPGADRPGADRPGNGNNRPGADRPDGDRPGDNRPGSDRPGADRPGTGNNNDRADNNQPGRNRPPRELNDILPNVPGTQDDAANDHPGRGDRLGDNQPGNDQPGNNRPGQNPGDRPGDNNGDRPGMDRPNRPGNNPGQPGADRPNRPDQPNPAGGNDNPARPNQPGTNPDRPDRPNRPNQPGTNPDNEPGVNPGRGGDNPTRPDRPNRPNQPGTNPGTNPGMSPGQPGGGGRPGQPGANPGQGGGGGQPNQPQRPNLPTNPGVAPGNAGGGNQPGGGGGRPGANRPGNQPGGQPGAGPGAGGGNRPGGGAGNGGGNAGGGNAGGGNGGGRGGNNATTDLTRPGVNPADSPARDPRPSDASRLDVNRPDRLPRNGYGIKTGPDAGGAPAQSGSTNGGNQPGGPSPERLRTADPERGAIGNGGLERRNPDSPRGGLTDRPSNPNRGDNVRPPVAPPTGAGGADRSSEPRTVNPGNLNRNSDSRIPTGAVREARPSTTPTRQARPTPAPATRETRPAPAARESKPAPTRQASPQPSRESRPAPAASHPPERSSSPSRGAERSGGGRERGGGGGRRGSD